MNMSGIGLVDILMAVLFILLVMLALTFGAYLIWSVWEFITVICTKLDKEEREGRAKDEHES